MAAISFKRRRVPFQVVRHAALLYFSFKPGIRDVEKLLAERSVEFGWE